MLKADMTGKFVIIRTFGAGVHMGTLDERDGQEVLLSNTRRIWYWDGAASLSELAATGTKEPGNCKFTVSLPSIILLDAIEIIPCTSMAQKNLESVPIWKS